MAKKRYSLFEHRHRFAAWAAARAAMRGLASVDVFCKALDDSAIKSFVHKHVEEKLSEEEFRKLHRKWCRKIVKSLNHDRLQDVPFGRAAKLVAVYLKTMIVVGPHSRTDLAKVAHPPVDRLLLQELARHPSIPAENRKAFRKTAWTELIESEYYSLIALLKTIPDCDPFWRLEQHWKGPQSLDD